MAQEIILRDEAERLLEDYLKKRNAFVGRLVANVPTEIPLERMQEMIQNPALMRQALADAFGTRGALDDVSATLTLEIRLPKRGREAAMLQMQGYIARLFEQIMNTVDADMRHAGSVSFATVTPEMYGLTERFNLREFYHRALSDGRLDYVPLGLVPIAIQRAREFAKGNGIVHIGMRPFADRLLAVTPEDGQVFTVDYTHDVDLRDAAETCNPKTPFALLTAPAAAAKKR